MDFSGSGFSKDAMGVGAGDAASGEDGESTHFLGELDEGTKLGDAGFGGGGSTRGEDATDPQGCKPTEGRGLVGDEVEGTMEGEGEILGGEKETKGGLDVDVAIGREGTTDDGGRTCGHGLVDVAFHDAHLRLGIDKVAFTRTDEDVDEQVGIDVAQLTDETDGRCESIQRERRAEFYAPGSAFDGSDRRGKASAAYFECIHFL